ncbi:MAG: DUF3592 domain-containing protein [Betaproteobacteria bacterium]|nr:DUF3592 domain-containing protein [Betaproteobacteria bacterium]
MKTPGKKAAGRGQILTNSQAHGYSMGQEDGEIGTRQALLQPISFSHDRLLGYHACITQRLTQSSGLILRGMDDPVILQAILTFWAGVLAGLVLGGLVGWRTKFAWGMAVGLLLIGAGGLAGAGWLGWHRFHTLAGTQIATGVLVEWVTERSTEASGKSSATRVPIVRFNAPDGLTYRVRGLGRGGEEDLPAGSAVQVRYRADAPNEAVIADFQNQWGGVWALALFGAIPMMMGAFFLATAISESREARRYARPPPLSAERRKIAQKLVVAGNLLLASAGDPPALPGRQ